MKSAITAIAALFWAFNSPAQSNPSAPVAVTIMVSPSSAATLASLQSNGVPMDAVIAQGAEAALATAQIRLRQQLDVMSYEQVAAAYPALVPLVDGTADPQIQWQQLRHLAAMQLSRVHTISDANAAAARHLAAIQALAKPDLWHTNVFLLRTNLYDR